MCSASEDRTDQPTALSWMTRHPAPLGLLGTLCHMPTLTPTPSHHNSYFQYIPPSSKMTAQMHLTER